MTLQPYILQIAAISAAISGAVTLILKYIFQKNIDSHAETLKHNLQKEVFNTQVIINVRHKIIPELYRLIMIADGEVGVLRGIRYEPTYEEYNESDFEELFERWNVKKGKREELLALIKNNREAGIKKWEEYKTMLERQIAKKALTDAKNYLLLNELYFDDNVTKSAHNAIKILNEYWIEVSYDFPLSEHDKKSTEWDKEIIQSIEELKVALISIMKAPH